MHIDDIVQVGAALGKVLLFVQIDNGDVWVYCQAFEKTASPCTWRATAEEQFLPIAGLLPLAYTVLEPNVLMTVEPPRLW